MTDDGFDKKQKIAIYTICVVLAIGTGVVFYIKVFSLWGRPVRDASIQNIYSIIEIPKGLTIGSGSMSHQIEEGADILGRGKNYADHYYKPAYYDGSLRNISLLHDHSIVPPIEDVSYHHNLEDLKTLKQIGLKFYRFSISWASLLPTGYSKDINKVALQYYSTLLDELEQEGIEVMIVLNYFDHPASFEDFGGWQDKQERIVDLYVKYAKVVFKHFGHRAKYFVTFAKPNSFCYSADALVYFNAKQMNPYPRHYICSNNILKAHAKAYRLYHRKYNPTKRGKVSIGLQCHHYHNEVSQDRESSNLAFDFECGWFAHPIFSKEGDYSPRMKRRIQESVKLQGLNVTDVPELAYESIKEIQGTGDFFYLLYSGSRSVKGGPGVSPRAWRDDYIPIEARLMGNQVRPPLAFPKPSLHDHTATGLRSLLNSIKRNFNNTEVHVDHVGISDQGGNKGDWNDYDRIKYIYYHVKDVINAINRDRCNVKTYIYGNLVDYYELWTEFEEREYGLVDVNFCSPLRPRELKRSGLWLKDVLYQNKFYLP